MLRAASVLHAVLGRFAINLSRIGPWEPVLAEETQGTQNNSVQQMNKKSCLPKPLGSYAV